MKNRDRNLMVWGAVGFAIGLALVILGAAGIGINIGVHECETAVATAFDPESGRLACACK